MSHATFFISAVTDEFKSYRDELRTQLDRPGVRVETQESFLPFADRTLVELDNYIQQCTAVVHLVGDRTGSAASTPSLNALLERHPDLLQKLQLTADEVPTLSYTQWEVLLAHYHGRRYLIVQCALEAPRDLKESDAVKAQSEREGQAHHRERLRRLGRYPHKDKFANHDELVIVVQRAWLELLPTRHQPVKLAPSLGSRFKGRKEWLARMRGAIKASRSSGVDAGRVAICGLGGLGKSQLAAEYAHLFHHEHSALLTVNASTPEDLEGSLAALAETLKLPEAASERTADRLKAVRNWLDATEHRGWILLIDNVDSEASFKAVADLMGALHHGHVVATSRLRQWPHHVTDLHLDVLPLESAVEYVLEVTDHRPKQDDGQDREQAVLLATDLDRLAIALVQAAATINANNWTLADYRKEWRERRELLIDDPDYDETLTGYSRNLAATWETSFDQLPTASRALLDVLCWFGPEAMAESWCIEPWPEKVIGALPGTTSKEINARKTLTTIYKYSLAEPLKDRPGHFTIHRLVQEVGRLRQNKNGSQAQHMKAALLLLLEEVKGDGSLAEHILNRLHAVRATLPHARQLGATYDRLAADLERNTRSHLHEMLAYAHAAQGELMDAQAEAMRSVVNARAAVSPGGSSPWLIDSLGCLALCEERRGQLGEALIHAQEAVVLAEGAEEPIGRLSIALNSVGRILELMGKLDEALKVFERIRATREALVRGDGENMALQRDLSIALNNVGRILEQKGKLDEALKVFERSSAICETLVKGHGDNVTHRRDLSIALGNVGRILEEKGKLDEALEVFERSSAIREALVKGDGENMAHKHELSIALNNVGRTLEGKGKLNEALKVFEQSGAICEALVQGDGENMAYQRDLSIVLENVGRIQEDKGKLNEAMKVFDRSSAIREALVRGGGENLAYAYEFTTSLFYTGRNRRKAGEFPLAIVHQERSLAILLDLQQKGYGHGNLQSDIELTREEIKKAKKRDKS